MSGFNIEKFINAFATNNSEDSLISSPAYFEAFFTKEPNCFSQLKRGEVYNRQIKTFNNLKFRASTADLPSRQMVSVQRAFNGPHKLVPYSSIYASTLIEFIETPKFDIRSFFDTWQGLIEGNQRNFETEYYEDLVSPEMVVQAYNRNGQIVRKWRFINVFPVSVNPTQLNWSTQNGITTVSVELSYYRWENMEVTDDGRTASSDIKSDLQNIRNKANSFVSAAKSFKSLL